MGTKGARTSGGTDKMAAAIRRARFMVRFGEKVCSGVQSFADSGR